METFLKFLGPILVLLGVVCIALYYFSIPSNILLLTALILEVLGIVGHILINKYID